MAQDVRQWLEEIKRLQQQLAEVVRDRDDALQSAAQWRQLYNTEAQQRRDEAKLHQQTLDTFKAELQKFQSFSSSLPDAAKMVAHQQEVEPLQAVDELKAKLVEVLLERDRTSEEFSHLVQALQQEKADHAETRKSLTSALADAVDLLAKAQGHRSAPVHFDLDSDSAPDRAQSAVGELPATKNPLLQLPPLCN